jgi:hypothetical protein
VQWLWPKLIQQELDQLRHRFNNHKVRWDKNKVGPSGVTPSIAFSLHEQYGAENLLQPIDQSVARALMEELGGEDVIRFVSVEYAAHAQAIFDSLTISELTLQNVWGIFEDMLPLMYCS